MLKTNQRVTLQYLQCRLFQRMKQEIVVLIMVKWFTISQKKNKFFWISGRWRKLKSQNENHFNGMVSDGTE